MSAEIPIQSVASKVAKSLPRAPTPAAGNTVPNSGVPNSGVPNSGVPNSASVNTTPGTTSAHAGDGAEAMIDEPVAGWFDGASVGFLISFLFHTCAVLLLALVPWMTDRAPPPTVIVSVPPPLDEPEKLSAIEEVAPSDMTHEEVGADSLAGEEMALASAAEVAPIASIVSNLEMTPQPFANIDLNPLTSPSVAPLPSLIQVKGQVGQGTTGASGAVDRITFEILKSLEERPTLVVWMFDESGSLERQRKEIRSRFDKIYEDLGILEKRENSALKKRADGQAPLLTSVIGFGKEMHFLTEQPTDRLEEIKQAVDALKTDESGIENVFQTVAVGAEKFKKFRRNRGSSDPARNVIFIVVTDERGDDAQHMESTIAACRKFAMPVYVIGVPAPFGRERTFLKYVDPDPNFDQTPTWAPIDQGPESLMLERVLLTSSGIRLEEEPTMDSGFGPFALTRLCFETGGIFFTVHPNRKNDGYVGADKIEAFASNMNYFFDPEVMSRYRPDYVSMDEYAKRVESSPLRKSLIQAARLSTIEDFAPAELRFVRSSEAELANRLTRAQQSAALLEPKLLRLYSTLEAGQPGRKDETSPRWLAGYTLELGRVLGAKVRTETYNAMLAKAKRGLVFKDAKNNTWVLRPSNDVSVGSKWEREAKMSRELLQEVVDQHEGTPWALLAKRELQLPVGWEWQEEFTDLAPPPRPGNAPDPPPNVAAPQDDQARMLQRGPPKRPVPKL
jgi:hypothetical protein